nr:hypothetical protein [Legionella pneumophila]
MKRYIWFHPSYVSESAEATLLGQKTNAKDHGYILLNSHELGQVTWEDHLTIMGHSSLATTPSDDTGLYMQGDTAIDLIDRLTTNGLKEAPKILSLESCQAGIPGGLAQQLSRSPFFKYTLIEGNLSGVGRKPRETLWNFPTDSLGRAVLKLDNSPWMFYLGGFWLGGSFMTPIKSRIYFIFYLLQLSMSISLSIISQVFSEVGPDAIAFLTRAQ